MSSRAFLPTTCLLCFGGVHKALRPVRPLKNFEGLPAHLSYRDTVFQLIQESSPIWLNRW